MHGLRAPCRCGIGAALRAGFDGVYLHTPLAYEQLDLAAAQGRDRDALARDMTALIVRISRYAKARRPGFLIVPQAGAPAPSPAPSGNSCPNGQNVLRAAIRHARFAPALRREEPLQTDSLSPAKTAAGSMGRLMTACSSPSLSSK